MAKPAKTKQKKHAPKSDHPFQVYLRGLSVADREELALACNTTYDYLRKMCGNGGRKPSPELAIRISENTPLLKSELRPDLWEAPKEETSAA